MNAIGGYFEFELAQTGEYHRDAFRLNSGRNALQHLLRSRRYRKVHIPRYACDALIQPFERLGVPYSCYDVNAELEPRFDFSSIQHGEAFLYVNYFGIKDKFVLDLSSRTNDLIVDNCQAFYSRPIRGCDTFYSPRKFFGVPDGAYLFCSGCDSGGVGHLPADRSHDRCSHLLLRLDGSTEDGYARFVENEDRVSRLVPGEMSQLTRRILSSIDYAHVFDVRRANYSFLHEAFASRNEFAAPGVHEFAGAPLAYPLFLRKEGLRDRLLQSHVYVARYWPDVLGRAKEGSLEFAFAKYMLPLPVDQRYGRREMHALVDLVERLAGE